MIDNAFALFYDLASMLKFQFNIRWITHAFDLDVGTNDSAA